VEEGEIVDVVGGGGAQLGTTTPLAEVVLLTPDKPQVSASTDLDCRLASFRDRCRLKKQAL
jgi:hypothetical protein